MFASDSFSKFARSLPFASGFPPDPSETAPHPLSRLRGPLDFVKKKERRWGRNVLTFFLLFVTPVFLMSEQAGKSKTVTSPMMQMPLVAPLFIEDGEFTSDLVLVNASKEKTYVDVTLRSANGQSLSQKRVPLKSTSQTTISIRELLQNAGTGETTGSVIVVPSPHLLGMSVAAQLTMTYHKYSQPSYIDEESFMPNMEGSQELHGVVDAGNGAPLMSIVNLSESTQHITITCIDDHEPQPARTVEFAGLTSKFLRACSPRQSVDSTDTEAETDDSAHSQRGTLGILLKTDGNPGSLAAFALNPHWDKGSVAFTSVPFSDSKIARSSGIVFVGVPVGSVPLLSRSGSFNPTLSLTNFGPQQATVTVKLATTSDSDNAHPMIQTVKKLMLPPSSSMRAELPGLNSSSSLKNSFIVESDAVPGQIGAKLVSYNASAGLRSEQLDKDERHMENAGLHPWTLQDGSDSTLLLFNHSSTEDRFYVHVAAGDVTWHKTYDVQPFETMALSLRQLQKEQTKDDEGEVLPEDIISGQIDWSNTSGPQGTGRILISNPELRLARSFSCAGYYELCGVSISPSSTQNINVGGTVYFTESNVAFCWAYNLGVCSGSSGAGGGVTGRTWSGSGQISGAGSCAGSTACTVTGGSPGTGYVWETVQDSWGCSKSSSQTPVNVKPVISSISPARGLIGTSLSVTISGTGLNGATVSAGSGITVTVNSSSATQINATFAIASSAPSGNHSVTVTASGQTSGAQNFYVQVPTRLAFHNYSSTTLVTITNGNVVDYFGNVLRTGRCGGYRNVPEDLLDQQGNVILGGNFTLTENFSNYSTTTNLTVPPPASFLQNTATQTIADTQFFGTVAPACPGSNDHESFDQSFVITIGSTNYSLTTVFHWQNGNYSGAFHVDGTTTTQ